MLALSIQELMTVGSLVLAALAVLLVLGVIAFGLFQARSLIRRELAAYFLSPIAYVVFVVFLALTGYLFNQAVDKLAGTRAVGVEYPLRTMYGDAEFFWLLFLFVPPVLTMRSFAEERASGTLEVLLTAPVRDWQVVLSKYAACLLFYVLLWLPTLIYLPLLLGLQFEFGGAASFQTPYAIATLAGVAIGVLGLVLLIPRLSSRGRLVSVLLVVLGATIAVVAGRLHYAHDDHELMTITAGLDPAAAWTLYLGVFLAGAMFLSLGLFISSLVRDQLVAALVALAVGLPFIAAAFFKPDLDRGGFIDQLIYFFSVPLHFSKTFTRGLLDTRPLVLYVTMTALFLFLTIRSLESRRWR